MRDSSRNLKVQGIHFRYARQRLFLVLSVVTRGFKITLSPGFPGVLRQVTNIPRNPVARATIVTEISSLLKKKAIVQVNEFPILCLSPIFVVPKRQADFGSF